jgi:hypothetical protein
MRILEQCSGPWLMLEMRVQIDALREAFSADTSKPFELKRGFPFNIPPLRQEEGPSAGHQYATRSTQESFPAASGHVNYNIIHPITCPIATSEDGTLADPRSQSIGLMADEQESSRTAATVWPGSVEPYSFT